MQTILRIVTAFSAAMFVSFAAPVFAESAPVYDADNMQQQDGVDQYAQSQDVTPGASVAGGGDQDQGFVPAQQMSGSGSSGASAPAPVAASGGTNDQRLKRIEQKLNAMQGADVNNRIESLQNEVQNLRGQVEDLTHQLQQAQAQQKAMLQDLDKRLSKSSTAPTTVASNAQTSNPAEVVSEDNVPSKLKAKAAKEKTEAAPALATKAPDAAAKPQPNVAEEQQIYQTAYNLIKAKKYKEATVALQNMLQKYPSGQFASNAHYWLGELYGLMGNNAQALTEFDAVVKIFPDSPRVSDAQLKVGLIFASQSKWQEARNAFKKVINRYPGTASARLASEQLKQIKDAGN